MSKQLSTLIIFGIQEVLAFFSHLYDFLRALFTWTTYFWLA